MTGDRYSEKSLARKRAALQETIGDIADKVSDRAIAAVELADRTADSLQEKVAALGDDSHEALRRTLRIVDGHIADSDISIRVGRHHLKIVGDESGLQSIEAELRDAMEGTDFQLDFDRDDGIDIILREAEDSSTPEE